MAKKTDLENKKLFVKEYALTLAEIKKHVQEAQMKAIFAANKELIKLYWFIGKTIAEKQAVYDWDSKVIDKLAQDLQNEFPGLAGFSKVNVFWMQAFYKAYEKLLAVPIQLEENSIDKFNIIINLKNIMISVNNMG